MRTDCPACHSARLSSRSHDQVYAGDRSIYAELLQIDSDLLALDTIGLSQTAWDFLSANLSVDVIAEKLGRHCSTIFRELKRNQFNDDKITDLTGCYCTIADHKSRERRVK